MLAVVTPNVALDRTLILPVFEHGAVLRPTSVIAAAGGKGLNAARAIRRLRGDACALGMIGGHTGAQVAALAAAEGLKCRWTEIEPETRVCTVVVETTPGTTTGLYETGQPISDGDWARFEQDVVAAAGEASAVCICGSLPAGIAPQRLAHLIGALKTDNRRVWVDTSGAALEAAADGQPWAIKVNADEASALLRTPIGDVTAALAAAETLCRRGVALVTITLGRDGAVLVTDDERWLATPASVPIVSAAGSGDALFGALAQAIAEEDAPYDGALRRAVATGTANAEQPGGATFHPERVAELYELTRVTRL